jgi:hypothetical protein
MESLMMSNEQIVSYLISDVEELIPQREALDINDSFGDYLEGLINRSQSVLRMMGVPEDQIPTDGSC